MIIFLKLLAFIFEIKFAICIFNNSSDIKGSADLHSNIKIKDYSISQHFVNAQKFDTF